ncbi:hypothetical protein, partial [Acinetobacter pittii]|uniref:hypothetical protein n=1 Tax=Acinetobacter pittii TaxID=48296 RepID=UPI00333016B0
MIEIQSASKKSFASDIDIFRQVFETKSGLVGDLERSFKHVSSSTKISTSEVNNLTKDLDAA